MEELLTTQASVPQGVQPQTPPQQHLEQAPSIPPTPAPSSTPISTPVAAPSSQPNMALACSLLRSGLIFVFGWAAVVMSLNPAGYLRFMPEWVELLMPRTLALHLFAGYEVILCIWLLTGKKMMYSAILTAVTIGVLTAVNYQEFGVLFRNVSIFFSAVALAVLSKNK